MKKYSKLVLALAFLGAVACKKSDDASSPNVQKINVLSGNLETQTLDPTKQYTLQGLVYVQSGKVLTIPAGTVILADKGSKAALVVNRGGQLIANGTETSPIVFTSNAPAGFRNTGDWGGIIICGKAPNNQGDKIAMEGPTDFSVSSGTDNGLYGGNVEADNSGSLKYVRVEYAGIAYAPNKEINSITFCSVGSGTTVEHVQASFGGDDSFEWFGGSVNAKYLVAYKGWDDDFDTDFGYRGKVQFGVALRGATLADQSGSNGFESDNDAAGSSLTPQTTAQFSNISILGPFLFVSRDDKTGALVKGNINANFQHAAHIRRNSGLVVANSVILGYPIGVNFDKTGGALKFTNNVVGVVQTRAAFTAGNNNDTTGFVAKNVFSSATNGTDVLANDNSSSTDYNPANDFKAGYLAANSPAKTGADFTNTGLTDASFWTVTTYRGAFDTAPAPAWNWESGWLNFDPQSKVY